MTIKSGIGKLDSERLSKILRGTKGSISVKEAAKILEILPSNAAKMLARWAKKGWLSRIQRGLYIGVPLESRSFDVALENPWLIAEKLYSPCYIGGWSAAEYWDLTEQIFRTIIVMTTRNPKNRNPQFKGTRFLLRSIKKEKIFGVKPIWTGQVKVHISDPSRTIIDLLNDPKLGGGIRTTIDIFSSYLKSENKKLDVLADYAIRIGNGAVLKRLGFLLERFVPNETKIINSFKTRLSKGNVKLDPGLSADKLITRWCLWIPDNWTMEVR